MTEQIKEFSLSEQKYVDSFIKMKNKMLANATASVVKKTQELFAAGKIGTINSDIPPCSELIRRMQDTRPICPDYKTIMVKTHVELGDGSGWFSGWGCDCKYEPKS